MKIELYIAVILVILLVNFCHNPSHGGITDLYKFAPIQVASFNVRHFGRGFLSKKPKATERLLTIMNRYDIIAIFETRDGTFTALENLKKKLTSTSGVSWDYVASYPLGKNPRYLEQYVLFYKVKSVEFLDHYQYENPTGLYSRPPFSAEFLFKTFIPFPSTPFGTGKRVVFMVLHTPPSNTPAELDALPAIIKSVAYRFKKSEGVIAMGDFNAGCRYLGKEQRSKSKLFTDPEIQHFIGDDVDTTVSTKSICAYDKVVSYGKGLKITRAKVYNFKKSFCLTQEEALKISDHYLVEFYLDAKKT